MWRSQHKSISLKFCYFLFQAEKNRQALAGAEAQDKGSSGPMRLYVGSLHFNITEEMLRGIFEPFGKVRKDVSFSTSPQKKKIAEVIW